MKTYIVGGYVRDIQMGLKPNDRDFVIVGANNADIERMISSGEFEQVGSSFPVFLHSETGEEYALARIERKIGIGYKGFECQTENVTLEQDLSRRDLTINAMAMSKDGSTIFDPFGGRHDIHNKLLRHVSDAFREDPLRVVRLARFYARFDDFTIHPDTCTLVREMVASGELSSIARERYWVEFSKVFSGGHNPVRFIEFLLDYNVWEYIFPQFARPTQRIMDAITYFKDTLPFDQWCDYMIPLLMFGVPNEKVNMPALKMPTVYAKKAFRLLRNGNVQPFFHDLDASKITDFITSQTFRSEEDVYYYIEIWDAINKNEYPQFGEYLIKCYDRYHSVDCGAVAAQVVKDGGDSLDIRDAIFAARVHEVKKLIGE